MSANTINWPITLPWRTFLRYYMVRPGETMVRQVYVIACFSNTRPSPGNGYLLLPEKERYMVYANLVTALKKAKAGALAYIDHLVAEGEAGQQALLQYRVDHYEDLNINLIETNIQKIEQAIKANPFYVWRPYQIQLRK